MLVVFACSTQIMVCVQSYLLIKTHLMILEGEWTRKPEPFRPLHDFFDDYETKDTWLAPVEPLKWDEEEEDEDS